MRDGSIPGGTGTGPEDPGREPKKDGNNGGGEGGGTPPDPGDYRKGTKPLVILLWVVGVLVLAGTMGLAIRVSNTPPPQMPEVTQPDPYR